MRWMYCWVLLFPWLSQAQGLDRAKLLYETKKYDEAKTLLEGIPEGKNDYAEAQYFLGRISFDQKDYDAAADYFDTAIEANPQKADYYNWLGNTYGTIAQDANLFKQGMLAPKMKNAWEKAIGLDAGNLDARFSLIQYYLKAPGIMGGSYDKAKEVARQIQALNIPQGHRSMGNILVEEKNYHEAEREYLEMVKADPNFSHVLGNFYVNQKQFDKAFPFFEDLLKKNSSDMIAVYQIGKSSALSGQRMDHGEECLKRYLQYAPKPNEPSHAGANMRLGQIYEKKGQRAEAKKHYEDALKMDSRLKEAEQGLQRTSK